MKIDGRTLSHDVSEQIRIMAVRRVREGERPSDVIRSYGLCRTTIYKWLRAARRGGEKALKARRSPGPKPKLTDRQKRQVFRWMNGKDPRQYGFDFGLWTRKVVQSLIGEKFGVAIAIKSFDSLPVIRTLPILESLDDQLILWLSSSLILPADMSNFS